MEYNMIHEANVSHDSEMANQEQMAAILNEALQSGSMPPFTVSSDTFILTPKECDPGSWSETGTYPCTPCDRGFYQPNKGATKCEACPDDQVTDDVGARNHTQCKGTSEEKTPTTIIVIVVVCILVIIIISVLIGFCIYIKIMKGKPHQKSGRESLPSAYSEIPEVTPITPYAEYHSEHDLHESPPWHVTNRPQPKPPVEDQAMDYKEGGYLVPQDIAKASQEDRGEYLAMNPGKTDDGYQKLTKDAEDNPSTITLEKDVPQSHQNINKKNEYKDYRDSNYLTPLDTRKLQEGDYTRMSGTTDDWYQKLNSDASGKVNEEYQKLQRNEEGGVQHVYLHFNNPVAKQDWDKDIEMEIMNK
ncbi:uncharacterized protein [Ptychodera flava]|uniref:uncharacterized protein n=1 Tax=Ptychodera flava TaxID=63121 RepID=UPI00396A97CE